MILSGLDLSVLSVLTGSLPAFVALAVAVIWCLDDELDQLPD